MIATILEAGLLWVGASIFFTLGWITRAWLHEANRTEEYYRDHD